MRVIPITARAGITGFESPAAEYSQLGISLGLSIQAQPL
jgi:DNA polymerase V